MRYIFCIVLCLMTTVLGKAVNDCSTPVAAEHRYDGGWPGVTQEQCEDRGMCWDDSCTDCPWCYRLKKVSGAGPVCPRSPLAASLRRDGGWVGITAQECVERGSCWDHTCAECIWCYLPPNKAHKAVCPATPLAADQREDAGIPGITAKQCVESGNCHDSSCGNCIWCYKPPGKN